MTLRNLSLGSLTNFHQFDDAVFDPMTLDYATDKQALVSDASGKFTPQAISGAGGAMGPGASTDHAVARWDGAGGYTLLNSGVIVDDSDNISGVGTLGCGAITTSAAMDMSASLINDLADAVNPTDAVNLRTLINNIGLIYNSYMQGSNLLSTTLVESEDYDAETLNATPVDTLSNLWFKSTVADVPTPFTIAVGALINFHFDAKVSTTSGVKAVTVQMRLYYVDADGTTGKTAIAPISDVTATLTTSKTAYEIHSHVGTEITVPAGKRLWVEIYANTSGASTNYPDLWIYRDSGDNHIAFGIAGGVLANFVRIDGSTPMTANWDIGNFTLTANGLTLDGTFTDGTISLASGTITGVATFGSFPITPSAAPTTDYQTANKKYVDDNYPVASSVTAAANMTDYAVLRGDGGAKGIQDSGIIIDDSDNMYIPGTLGVGTATPGAIFRVKGTNNDTYIGRTFSNTINFSYEIDANADGWINYRSYQGGFTQFRDLNIGNGKGGLITFFDGSSGNVGINDATPSYKLDVNGTGRFTGALLLNSTLTLGDNDKILLSTDGEIYSNGDDIIFRTLTANRDLLFYGLDGAVDTLLLRLDSDVPAVKPGVDIQFEDRNPCTVNIEQSGAGGDGSDLIVSAGHGNDSNGGQDGGDIYLYGGNGPGGTDGDVVLGFVRGGAARGMVGVLTDTPNQALDVIGTIQASNLLGGAINLTTSITGNIIRDPSDRKLKRNIIDIVGALDKVTRLQGVSFNWDESRIDMGSQTEFGLIAQDVEDVASELVVSPKPVLDPETGEDTKYMSIKYNSVVALLVEAVKTQQARILALETA